MIALATTVLAAGDPFNPNYGCWPADVPCQAAEAMARTLGSTIINFGNFCADMIVNAFNNPIGAASWDVAHGQFLFWVAVMAPVIMIIAIVQVGISAIMQDWRRLGRVVAGAVIAVPFSAICVYGMQQFSSITDSVTNNLTSALQGGSMSKALLSIVGLGVEVGNVNSTMTKALIQPNSVLGNLATAGAHAQTDIGSYVLALVLVGVMAIAAMFLFIAMSLRAFGLIALAALAPIGLMMIGQPKFSVWAERWASLALGLLLAKPLAAGVLLLAVQLTGTATNVGMMLVFAGAMFAAAFSPLWATSLVSFAGREVGSALHRRISIREQVSRGSSVAAPARSMGRLARR